MMICTYDEFCQTAVTAEDFPYFSLSFDFLNPHENESNINVSDQNFQKRE